MVASSEYCALVRLHPEKALTGNELSDLERRRLISIANQRGMRVNTAIHRANRLASIAQTLPFTCFLISECRQEIFDRYWAAHPTENLQLPVESERFAKFLIEEIEEGRIEHPYLGEVVAFERICTKLRFYTESELEAQGWTQKGMPALVRVVCFRHDPVALLNALSESRIPPNVETGDFHLAIDFRTGDADFRLLDDKGIAALRELSPVAN